MSVPERLDSRRGPRRSGAGSCRARAGVGGELHAPFGLDLAGRAATIVVGRTRATSVRSQPPAPEARPPAEHDQARPAALDGVGEQGVLGRGQEVGGEVAEDVNVVTAGREVLVADLAALPRRAGLRTTRRSAWMSGDEATACIQNFFSQGACGP